MTTLDEPTRLSGHLFADVVTAWNSEDGVIGNAAAVNRVLERQATIGAVTATIEGEQIRVNLDAVNRSAAIAVNWLASRLAAASGSDRESIAAELREFFDQA